MNRTPEHRVQELTLQLEESHRNYETTLTLMKDLLEFKKFHSALSGRLLVAPAEHIAECIRKELGAFIGLLQTDFAALYIAQDKGDAFKLISQAIRSGEPVPVFPESSTLLMSLDALIRGGTMVMYHSLDNSFFTDYPEERNILRRIGINALVAVPLFIKENVSGAIVAGNRTETSWPASTPRRLRLCGEVMAGAWLRGISEMQLRNSRDRLRALAIQLSDTEARQCERMAAWIHDQVGQDLALVKLKLGMAYRKSDNSEVLGDLDDARKSVDTLLKECREQVMDLCPPILKELGLGPAIEWYAGRIAAQHNLLHSLQFDARCASLSRCTSLPRPLATVLFGCAKELMVNTVKHAKVHRLAISLSCCCTGVDLTIEDDGIGIDPELIRHPASGHGFGLISIMERVADLGGSFSLGRRQGGGTIAVLHIDITPVDQCDDQMLTSQREVVLEHTN